MWAAMEAHDLDVLVMGRVANMRYASGVPILWNAGTRPFGPGCVAVRATRDIHLLSTWDEGVPDDIPHDHLYGITWNPMNYVKVLQDIDARPERVGTDGMSPLFAQLLPMAFPDAAIVDGGPALSQARRIKTDEEVTAVAASIAVAETSMAAAVAELRPGVSERELAGVFMDAMASAGVTTPLTQDVARIVSTRSRTDDGRVQVGDLVGFHAGVVAGGYAGEVGRTWPVEPDGNTAAVTELYRRSDRLRTALLEACTPGAPASALLDAYRSAAEPIPELPVGRGLGLGYDDPVVVGALPATAAAERLDPGVVMVITACVHDDALGSVITHDPVLITTEGPQALSHAPRWSPENAGVPS
jgi:Xaa-Pro dipeptidase